MKKYIIYLLMMFTFLPLKCKNCLADSIFIIGFDKPIDFNSRLNRQSFLRLFCDYLNGETIDFTNHIDTLITNREEIDSIMQELDNLQVCDTLPYSSNQVLMYINFSLKKKKVGWAAESITSLDNRILLVVYFKREKDFIWLDPFRLDKGNKRYLLSQRMRYIISRYSHIYDDFLSK